MKAEPIEIYLRENLGKVLERGMFIHVPVLYNEQILELTIISFVGSENDPKEISIWIEDKNKTYMFNQDNNHLLIATIVQSIFENEYIYNAFTDFIDCSHFELKCESNRIYYKRELN